MPTCPEVRHLSVTIERPVADVYAFVADPANLPRWAQGLSGSITNVDGEWIAVSPMGTVRVRFAERNAFGVLDHEVVTEAGERFHNPMRVIANGTGSELVFTLFRRPGMSDAELADDAIAIARDLEALKRLLETGDA
jgi:uncharacterized protein YndB with AHSA1/START domain